tara:strand:+ start:63664 stop:64392 length:729 start_codon:yes stop_codon:yes gene_type:complete
MTASKNFFSKPFGVFLIVAIIVGIGVGIYFGVKDNNNTGTTNTLNFGQNFRVTYYNTEGTNIQDGFTRYLEEAMTFWEDKVTEDTRLDLDVMASPLDDRRILAYGSMNNRGNIRGGGDITINLNAIAMNWADVLKHEIGHVMGIGLAYKWTNAIIRNEDGAFLRSTEFPETYAVYRDEYRGTFNNIPLGDSAGHFRENIFTTELMTPYSNEGRVQPATDLTLSALSSLGWNIDLSKAEERRN